MKQKWTAEHDEILKKMVSEDKTCKEIAILLNRTLKSVQHRFNILGLKKPTLKVGDKVQTFTITEIYNVNTGRQNITMAKYVCDCGLSDSKRLTYMKKGSSIYCPCSGKKCRGKNRPVSVGDKFNRLTVIEMEKSIVRCRCDCGNEIKIPRKNLFNCNTSSCGCFHRELISEKFSKHKSSNSRLYNIWQHMKTRCQNTNRPDYYYYGGRGISVCDKWKDYKNFEEWALSNGYSEELTIDRIDVNGNYLPENCKWSTRKEQANNRRPKIGSINPVIAAFGQSKTLNEWMEDPAIQYKNKYNVIYRINAGWPVEQALMEP